MHQSGQGKMDLCKKADVSKPGKSHPNLTVVGVMSFKNAPLIEFLYNELKQTKTVSAVNVVSKVSMQWAQEHQNWTFD